MFPRSRDVFPPPDRATPEGVLAIGGKPEPDLLLAAYSRGVFPWPHSGLPLLWFCPDPRFVLVPTPGDTQFMELSPADIASHLANRPGAKA